MCVAILVLRRNHLHLLAINGDPPVAEEPSFRSVQHHFRLGVFPESPYQDFGSFG